MSISPPSMITVEVQNHGQYSVDEWNELVDLVRKNDLRFVGDTRRGTTSISGPYDFMVKHFDIGPLNYGFGDRAYTCVASYAGGVSTSDLYRVMSSINATGQQMAWFCHRSTLEMVFARLSGPIGGLAWFHGPDGVGSYFWGDPIIPSSSMASSLAKDRATPLIVYGPLSMLGLPLCDIPQAEASALFLSKP